MSKFNEVARVGHVNQAVLSSDGVTSVGTTSTEILAANLNRKMLKVTNNHSSAVIRVRIGSAATSTAGVALNPEQTLLLDRVVPTGSVNVISDTASTSVYYAEYEDE